MSYYFLKHVRAFSEMFPGKSIFEALDFEDSDFVSLNDEGSGTYKFDDFTIEISISKIEENESIFLIRDDELFRNYNGNYYNFGFMVNGSESLKKDLPLDIHSKIMKVVMKTLFEWIKNNSPDIVIITTPQAERIDQSKKRLYYYGSILSNKIGFLRDNNYGFSHFQTLDDKTGIYIYKEGFLK